MGPGPSQYPRARSTRLVAALAGQRLERAGGRPTTPFAWPLAPDPAVGRPRGQGLTTGGPASRMLSRTAEDRARRRGRARGRPGRSAEPLRTHGRPRRHDGGRLHPQVAQGPPHRALRRAAALPRPVRAAGPPRPRPTPKARPSTSREASPSAAARGHDTWKKVLGAEESKRVPGVGFRVSGVEKRKTPAHATLGAQGTAPPPLCSP